MNRISRVFFAAMLLSLAFAQVAFAGWEKDEKGYKYIEDGSMVYGQWRTDSAGDYFWLGYDGYMVVSSFVDTDRYVDSTGRMVHDRWMQINDKWHYFESNGKMAAGKKKVISNQIYFFDYDGCMVTGWYNDGSDWYYCDEAAGGHALTNTWKQLDPDPLMAVGTFGGNGDGPFWFYFQNNGRMVRATAGEYKEMSIDGSRYAFDTNGIMQTGWVKISDTDPAIAGYKYFNDNQNLGTYGAAHAGWLSAYPPEGLGDSGEARWYYFDVQGRPAHGTESEVHNGSPVYNPVFKKIPKNGTTYTYLFNNQGNPVYGLVQVKKTDGEYTSMYFGTKNQSCLQRATHLVEGDGTAWQYCFNNSGYGITGIQNGYVYYKGKAQRAVDDKLSYYNVNGQTYLVNPNGYIVKNYNRTKQAGTVDYKSDGAGRNDGGTAPVSSYIEPEFQEQE